MDNPVKLTVDEIQELSDNGEGICISCGDINQGLNGWCEPDAENYTCDNCEEDNLQGIELAMLNNHILVVDSHS